MATRVQITFDAHDPRALGEFWADVLGYVMHPPPEGFDSLADALAAWGVPEDERNSPYAILDPDGAGPRLFFQKVPEAKTAKNRVQLDVIDSTQRSDRGAAQGGGLRRGSGRVARRHSW